MGSFPEGTTRTLVWKAGQSSEVGDQTGETVLVPDRKFVLIVLGIPDCRPLEHETTAWR